MFSTAFGVNKNHVLMLALKWFIWLINISTNCAHSPETIKNKLLVWVRCERKWEGQVKFYGEV